MSDHNQTNRTDLAIDNLIQEFVRTAEQPATVQAKSCACGGFVSPYEPLHRLGLCPACIELRDRFAAAALAGMEANPEDNGTTRDAKADWAYNLSEAMLARRVRGQGE